MEDKEAAQDDDIETQIYELGYHIIPSVGEKHIADEAGKIKSSIEKAGGVLIAEESPKTIHLAYSMIKKVSGKNEKYSSAYFGWIKFEIKTDGISRVKAALDDNGKILRFLIIKTVRESTRAPKSALSPITEVAAPRKIAKAPPKKIEKSVPISEEELDRTIEELLVE
jgi:ribosomal protein S6